MFDWILELVPDVTVSIGFASPIPLFMAHETFLALCRPCVPLFEIIVRALALLHRGKVDEDSSNATRIGGRLAIQKTHEKELLRSGIRYGC